MEKLHEKLLELHLKQGIEDSKIYLDYLYLELKMYKNNMEFLELEKPFWFQKKKILEYKQKKIDLEEKISKCQQSILEELELVFNMRNS